MDKIRLATIGTSKITEFFAAGTHLTKNIEHVAVYSRSRETGEVFASARGNLPVFTEMNELASSDAVDAVYIASPNKFHFEQAKLFIEHGKHVICEKSISAQPSEVEELVELAKARNVIFMEAMMFMHLPQRRILQDALSKIGEIHSVNLNFCQRSSRLDAFKRGDLPNIFNPICETGALLDLGVYCVYPALYYFGVPEKVIASSVLLSTGVDGSGSVILQYPDKLVTLNYSKLCQGDAPSQFVGDEGCVTVSSISQLDNITLHERGKSAVIVSVNEDKPHLMSHEAEDLAEFITGTYKDKDYYDFCTKMMLDVSKIMYEIRMQTGIVYESDRR